MFYKIEIDFSSKNTNFKAEFIAKESLTYKDLLRNIGKLIFKEFEEHGSANFVGAKLAAIEHDLFDIKYYLPSGIKVFAIVDIREIELIQ